MSHTLELLETIEHGTVAGYRAGCHGSAISCGGAVSCQTVFIRYQADWGFRKRVDAGESPSDIVLGELAELDAVRARDKAANRKAKAKGARTNEARLAKRARQSKPKVSRTPVHERLAREIADLSAQRVPVREIAERLQVSMTTVTRARRTLGVSTSARELVDRDEVVRLYGERYSDTAIGAMLGASNSAIGHIRRQLGLEKLRSPRPAPDSAQGRRERVVRDLHALGKTDAEIGAAIGISQTAAYHARERIGLPKNPKIRKGQS